MTDPEWVARRNQAVTAHAADLERRAAADIARARESISAFLDAVRGKGIAPVPLRARSYDGRYRYRTGLRGWYLHSDEAMAVGEDGQFYILTVPASVRALVAGARPQPSPPRTIIGEGGRDGDRIPLDTLLGRILSR